MKTMFIIFPILFILSSCNIIAEPENESTFEIKENEIIEIKQITT
jgi:hypothetical protein